MKRESIIRDALYNLSHDNTHNMGSENWQDLTLPQIYGQGVLVGVMATLMAIKGYSFQEAASEVSQYLPENTDPEAINKYWHDDFGV